ncbi:hypothetical protein AB1Y20_003007 [Prymnesium parvum]|uniref:Glutamine cyclotransferase n=1 Tax=Prymnesium parvum TaxID=97485 RepID=A0AB34JAP9_PRYPA
MGRDALLVLAALSLLAAALVSAHGANATVEAKAAAPRTFDPHLPYVSTFEIVAAYPHPPTVFTQGLAFDEEGTLFESQGLFGKSGVREVEVRTGKTVKWAPQPQQMFGEGLEVVGNKLIQLTWKNNAVFEYRKDSLEMIRKVDVNIGREGWGLAADPSGKTLYITDSTDMLFVVEPETYKVISRFKIVDELLGPKAIFGVNELEWVNDELWGNVYPMYQGKASECIVRIDPTNGHVKGWIDMRGLLDKQDLHVRRSPMNNVLNGIAYHAQTDRLYVTGKMWNNMYQIRVQGADALSSPAHIHHFCHLG